MQYINKTRFFALFLVLTLLFTLASSYAKAANERIADAVVRLHIVAHDNSKSEQALKLKVRDRILKDAFQFFEGSKNSEEALSFARANLDYIKNIAEDEIRRQGFDHKVRVTTGNFGFPTKTYGDISLPAGRYNAVRIEIGKADGENWWCVMYPPLCFTEGTLFASDEAKTQLQQSLSAGDYELICQNDSSPTPVRIKFKIVEFFRNLF